MKDSVFLRVYDISDGLAKLWSPLILGKKVEGVWHTGVEAYGFEYFYGGGIVKMRPENVEATFGISPVRVHNLGPVEVSRLDFEKYLLTIMTMFRKECYDLVNWNCNHFSDHVVHYLTGRHVPSYILELPNEVCKSFMGKLILNFMKMINGGSAPIASDDPMHPRQILAGQDSHVRRNSCPASPSRSRGRSNTMQSDRSVTTRSRRSSFSQAEPQEAPQFLPSKSVDYRLSSGKTDRGFNRGRSVVFNSTVDDNRGQSYKLEVIPGAQLADTYDCELVISPRHRKMYEMDKRAMASQLRPSDRSKTMPANSELNLKRSMSRPNDLQQSCRVLDPEPGMLLPARAPIRSIKGVVPRKDRRSKTMTSAPTELSF